MAKLPHSPGPRGELASSSGRLALPAVGASAHLDWTDRLSCSLATSVVLVVYLLSVAPSVTLEWSGIFTAGSTYGGVPFSGGYPAWTIYAWAFTRLVPVGNVAWRVNLSSAVGAALACGLVAMLVSFGGKMLFDESSAFSRLRTFDRKIIRGVCGYVAGLVFGLSGAVWGKAVVGEFWAFGALLFTGVLWMFTRWFFGPATRWRLYGAFFVMGMLLTNNQELLVALPALVAGVTLADEKLGRDSSLIVLPLAAVLTALDQWWLWIDFPSRPNRPILTLFLGAVGSAPCLLSKHGALARNGKRPGFVDWPWL